MARKKASENVFPIVRLGVDDPPATPPAGQVHVFADTDKLPYIIDEDAVVTPLGGGGVASHLADTSDAHDASAISVLDTGAHFTATDVEAALAELFAALGGGGGPTYSSYTPALTASTTDPTLGSGSTAAGRYFQNGKHVHAEGRFLFGTSGVSNGSGVFRVSLPVTAAASSSRLVGYAYLYDDSTGAIHVAMIGIVTSTTGQFLANAFVPAAATAPWTWAANDAILFTLDYEAA